MHDFKPIIFPQNRERDEISSVQGSDSFKKQTNQKRFPRIAKQPSKQRARKNFICKVKRRNNGW